MLDRYASAHSSPPMSISTLLAEADNGVQECEALLKRAIEIVRGQTRRSRTRSLTESKPSRVVRIHHEPDDAAYVAIDAKSALSVLRHRDSTRLRAMCERIGWQVVGGEVASAD